MRLVSCGRTTPGCRRAVFGVRLQLARATSLATQVRALFKHSSSQGGTWNVDPLIKTGAHLFLTFLFLILVDNHWLLILAFYTFEPVIANPACCCQESLDKLNWHNPRRLNPPTAQEFWCASAHKWNWHTQDDVSFWGVTCPQSNPALRPLDCKSLAVLTDYHFSPLAAAYLPIHCNLGKDVRLSWRWLAGNLGFEICLLITSEL